MRNNVKGALNDLLPCELYISVLQRLAWWPPDYVAIHSLLARPRSGHQGRGR